MDIHFVNTVLTVPRDHPRWETELLAQLAGVTSPGSAAASIASGLAPDGNSFSPTCDERVSGGTARDSTSDLVNIQQVRRTGQQ